MPDFAPWQDDEYRRLHFDPADPTLGDGHRIPIPADVSATVSRAYVNAGLMFPCDSCAGTFWSTQALEVHREKRHR